MWNGEAEDDGMNRLVLGAGMSVVDVAVLRAYARYLRQIGLSYSRLFVEQTPESHPTVARLLVDLFAARFDPDRTAGDADAAIPATSNPSCRDRSSRFRAWMRIGCCAAFAT